MRLSPCIASKHERNVVRSMFAGSLLSGVGFFVGGFFLPPLWVPSGIMLGAALSAYQTIATLPDVSNSQSNTPASQSNPSTLPSNSHSVVTQKVDCPPTRPNTPLIFTTFRSSSSSDVATTVIAGEESPRPVLVV